MDFNKLKVYGFPRHLTKYKFYNPAKVRYLKSKEYGYFECSKQPKIPEVRHLADMYKQRTEYEKYMNPKGYKYSWTSGFPKVGDTIDFANPKIFLVRSEKNYGENEIKFLVDKKLSKIEISQFIQKLYRFRVRDVNTAILPGQVKRIQKGRGAAHERTRDIKKAVVKLDFKVDEFYRKIKS
jgi:ribosomal protein L23